MMLSEEDRQLFYRVHPVLLHYANQQLKIQPDLKTLEAFMVAPMAKKQRVWEEVYNHPDLIRSFLEENPAGLSPEDLSIARQWTDFIRGDFFIIRHLKNYTVFLDEGEPAKAYGVLGLSSGVDEVVGPYLPLRVRAVLLPFKDRIIYDGFIAPYRVFFGPGISKELNATYQEAKARFDVITSLPFAAPAKQESDLDRLRFYLKNQETRDRYWEEIGALIHSDPVLMTVYHQEMGKYAARSLGRKLREMGFNDAWFGLMEGMVIAAGKTREDLERTLAEIAPEGKEGWIYRFHLKEK